MYSHERNLMYFLYVNEALKKDVSESNQTSVPILQQFLINDIII